MPDPFWRLLQYGGPLRYIRETSSVSDLQGIGHHHHAYAHAHAHAPVHTHPFHLAAHPHQGDTGTRILKNLCEYLDVCVITTIIYHRLFVILVVCMLSCGASYV